MTTNSGISHVTLAYLITIPLALVVGYSLSNPLSTKSLFRPVPWK